MRESDEDDMSLPHASSLLTDSSSRPRRTKEVVSRLNYMVYKAEKHRLVVYLMDVHYSIWERADTNYAISEMGRCGNCAHECYFTWTYDLDTFEVTQMPRHRDYCKRSGVFSGPIDDSCSLI